MILQSLLASFSGSAQPVTPVTIDVVNLNLVCEGNSLTIGTQGNPGKSYPTLVSENAYSITNNWTVSNSGVNSATTQDIIDEYAVEILPKFDPLVDNVLILWEVTNDLYFGGTNQGVYDRFAALCNMARADGFIIIALTTLPRGQTKQDGTPIIDYNNDLDAVNLLLKNNQNNYTDFLIDVREDSRLTDYDNTTYFAADKIHLVEAGYQIIADMVIDMIQTNAN